MMAYHRLYYHLIWATKDRKPLITPEVETAVYRHVCGKVHELGGVSFAVNGVSDHVHLVSSVPPKISVAEFMRQVKGVSSALYNRDRGKRCHPSIGREIMVHLPLEKRGCLT